MPYRQLADVVVVSHAAFLIFLATGSLLAVRWRKLLLLHIPSLAWGLFSITIGIDCPLTILEKYFLRVGGEPVYRGGFIDHYIDGALYPDRYSIVVATLVGLAAVSGYVWLWRRHRGRVRSAETVLTPAVPASRP